ncbi:uncharacterized protein LOC129230408 [Uloborus diversus]|uniref:uncharacterized protein LOC129230408 n=1 Tax=Uloborus diversus TaxID=327109 RepID=UPI0024092EAB|nr:uncharacterized protein LOC129230408 [Uloborus diversus]
MVEILKDIYSNSTTAFMTSSGISDPRPVETGVRQGCPLSGLIFNITIDFLIRETQENGPTHNILAYADDLVLVAGSHIDLQESLDKVCDLASRVGLRFNPGKCFSLHLGTSARVGARDTTFYLDGSPIPTLMDGSPGTFLGRPVGSYVPKDTRFLEELKNRASKILEAKLAPWQRLDALKTFFFPSLNFLMRTSQFAKSDWAELDKHIRPLIKKTLNIPKNAANEYFLGPSERGLFGIPVSAEDSDISHIDSAFKLLTSKDPIVKELAWDEVKKAAHHRFPSNDHLDSISKLLSGEPANLTSNKISSNWTRARAASTRLHVKWNISESGDVSITVGDKTIFQRRAIFKTLRSAFKKARADGLKAHPHQGKTFECFGASKASSHFNSNGGYTRFADWRFVHRARLGLVPLNAYRHGPGPIDKRCRKCGHDETLPHVLCHCMTYSASYQRRHNQIVDRIKKAALGRWSVVGENQALDDSGLRPDLVLEKGDAAIIIDVTVPFEKNISSFQDARENKIRKYTPLAETLKNLKKYKSVTVDAIVVGSLGSWDKDNDKTVRRLCLSRYAHIMRKLIVSDTIRTSRDIYIEHISGRPQQPWIYRNPNNN